MCTIATTSFVRLGVMPSSSSMPSTSTGKTNGSTDGPSAKASDRKKCRVCTKSHSLHKKFTYRKREYDTKEMAWLEWIKCADCKSVFHIGCVGMQPYEQMLVASFVCEACEKDGRKTIMKTPVQLGETTSKLGSQNWITSFLLKKTFQNPPIHRDQTLYGAIPMEDGAEFKAHFDHKRDWRAIYLIKNKSGLGLQVPPSPFGMDELVKDMKVKPEDWLENVIDVTAQTTTRMTLDRFCSLFKNKKDRARIYNILSLEYSMTGLAEVVVPPEIYRIISLADRYWPLNGVSDEQCDPKHHNERPSVERYVLIGMGGSYTDFHIDFGGSSVWYHVYQGQKVFYVAPPTEKNLKLFEDYKKSDIQDTVFLGDSLDDCWKVTIDQGNTLLIPSGYVHAVYTPVDSIVFGGNFLTLQGLEIQIAIHEMDTRRELGDIFGYPHFDTVMYYASLTLVAHLNEYCQQKSKGDDVVADYLDGAKHLVTYLNTRKEVKSRSKMEFARGLSKLQIVKKLEEAVKLAEEASKKVATTKKEGKKQENGRNEKKMAEVDREDESSAGNGMNVTMAVKKRAAAKRVKEVAPISPIGDTHTKPTRSRVRKQKEPLDTDPAKKLYRIE